MKRVISMILCACMLLGAIPLPALAAAAAPGTETQAAATTITTEEEFRAIAYNTSGYYILGADLNLSADAVAAMQRCYFTGTLDGRNHTITAQITGIDAYRGAGLFNGIDGTVKDLTLRANLSMSTTIT